MARSVACAFFFDAEPLCEPERHALDACALCAKSLSRNCDIFMYKGDTPFCSEDCRYEQIEHDLACARQQASSRRKQQQQQAQRAPAAAPPASAVSAKADVSVAS